MKMIALQIDLARQKEKIDYVKSYVDMAKKYGYNTVDGEEIYFIPNPALGLWINREKF